MTIRISSHRKVLLFQTSALVQFSQLCSLLKLQPCWNQSTFVSMLPSVPLQSDLFPSPFAFIFPQTQAPRHTLLFLAFPHSLSFLVFFPLNRIHADLKMGFLGWVLEIPASLLRAGCWPALEDVSPTHFAHRCSHVTPWPKHPQPEESRGEPLFYHLRHQHNQPNTSWVSCRVELASPRCFLHQPRAAAVTGFLHRQQRTYNIPVLPSPNQPSLPSPNHSCSAFCKPKGWQLSPRYISPWEQFYAKLRVLRSIKLTWASRYLLTPST